MKPVALILAASLLMSGGAAWAQVTEGKTTPPQKPKVEKPVSPKAPVAPKTEVMDPGAVFAGLIGSCWQAAMDQGNSDTHCFTVAFNGKLVMDVHKVRNASQVVVYEGVTVYRPDKATRSLAYEYSNSFGNLITGQGWRVGEVLNFASQMGQQAKPETVWRINKDGYEVTPADPKAAKLQFKRISSAEGGL
jgi:hypothetical protein